MNKLLHHYIQVWSLTCVVALRKKTPWSHLQELQTLKMLKKRLY